MVELRLQLYIQKETSKMDVYISHPENSVSIFFISLEKLGNFD